MALVVNINSVSKGIIGLSLNSSQNERDRLTGTLVSLTGADQPDIDDVVEVIEDGTYIFGGTIKNPTLRSHADAPPPTVATGFSALDNNEIGDRQTCWLTIPEGTTLKDAATMLLPYLPGVSIDPSWSSSGPTLPRLVYEDEFITVILDQLCQYSGWLRNIGPTKLLKFFEAGTQSAPWNIADNDGNTVGDITVAYSRVDYANRIILRFSEAARAAYAYLVVTGNFSNGETVVVGSRTYNFRTTLTDVDGYVLIGASAAASVANLIAAITRGAGNGTVYAETTEVNGQAGAHTPSSATIMMAYALAAGDSGNSIACTTTAVNAQWVTEGSVPCDTFKLGYDQSLRNRIVRDNATEQALYGIYTRKVEAPSIFDDVSATDLADAILVTSAIVQKTISYTTYRGGLTPGMTQTIQATNRGLNEACLITSITHQWDDGRMRRTVNAIAGNVYKGDRWRDQYKKWSGGGSSSTTAALVSGGGGGGGSSSGSGRIYPLGGSSSAYQAPNPAAWAPIPNWIPVYGSAGFNAKVYANLWARNAGVTATVRLVSSVDGVTWPGTVVTTLSTVTSQTPTPRVSATVTIQLGLYYRLEILSSANSEGVAATGYLEQV